MKKNRLYSIAALVVALAMIVSCLTFGVGAGAEQSVTTAVVTSPFTAAIAAVRDSVVGVSNYQTVRYSNYNNGYGNFGYGFGNWYGFGYGYGNGGNNDTTTEEKLYATGSGVVIAKNYVITNYHVVESATKLSVTVSHDDGSNADEYDAELVAYDENLDIAILYSEKLELSPVVLGDSDSLVVGDWAICIGNPLSSTFSGTVTAGIVSGLNRTISSSSSSVDRYGRKTTTTNTMIQIDAAINSGNSGGGMFNTAGELMGIPTLKYSSSSYSSADVDGIGMCIPINSCKALIEEVLTGNITSLEQNTNTQQSTTSGALDMTGRPRMGLTMTTLSSSNGNLSYALRYGAYYDILPDGVYVTAVDTDGPAAKAGIQVGDIIVDVDGTAISSSASIQQIVAAHNAGDKLVVKVYRIPGVTELENTTEIPDGEYIDIEVTLAIVDAL